MKKQVLLQNVWFILISAIGGFLLSLAGMSIGWIVGTMLLATILTFTRPKQIGLGEPKPVHKMWRQLGQVIFGIELGRKINTSIMDVFIENWFIILISIVISIVFSLLTGLLLWKFTNVSALTGMLATAPGGIVTMPTVAQDVGANTGVVSVAQLVRVFFVVTLIPVALSLMAISIPESGAALQAGVAGMAEEFSLLHLVMTIVFLIAAYIGSFIARKLKFPAPWLVGSLLGVTIIQISSITIAGQSISFWWPSWLVILGQIFLGAAIGSGYKKEMFVGVTKTLIVSSIGTIALIIVMFGFSYLVSMLTGISLITSVLAFAPGGVVEMSATAVILQADSTFVVTVQVLRLVLVILTLPPFFRYLHARQMKKNKTADAGVGM